MATHAPHRLVALLSEPLMAQLLSVKVMHFKGAMVHMDPLGIHAHENRVVIRMSFSKIKMGEHGHDNLVAIFLNIEQVTRHDVEVGRVELDEGVHILCGVAKMTQL